MIPLETTAKKMNVVLSMNHHMNKILSMHLTLLKKLTDMTVKNITSIQWTPGSQIYLSSKKIIFDQK